MKVLFLSIISASLYGQAVSNSLVLRQTVSGDKEQLDISDVYGSQNSPSQAMTNFGLHGMDEGASAKIGPNQAFIFSGDAVGATFDVATSKWLANTWRTNCDFGAGNTLCLGAHPMILLPLTGHQECHSMENLRATIMSTSTQASTCPTATVITDATHTGQVPKFAYHSIANAQSGDAYGAGNHPTGVFAVGTTLYGIHRAQTVNLPTLNLATRSVLLKANIPTTSINATTAPTWTRAVTWTQAPAIPNLTVTATNGSPTLTRTAGTATSTAWADTGLWEGVIIDGNWHVSGTRYYVTAVSGNTITLNQNVTCETCTGLQLAVMPKQEINTGKFAESSCEPMAAADMPAAVNALLPAPLHGQNVLWCFGASYAYRKSNLYLFVMKANVAEIDAATYSNGLSNGYYLTGLSGMTPTWTLQDEDSAVPLLNTWTHVGVSSGLPCIGENSVRWHPLIQRFILGSASAEHGGAWVRMTDGAYPWLWSNEVRVAVNHNQTTDATSWHAQAVHSPSNDNFNFTLYPPVYDPDTASPYTQFTSVSPWSLNGNFYGFFQLPADSDVVNSDGSIRMFTLISGFNPYVSWVASFDVQPRSSTGLRGRVSITGLIR